MAAYDLLPKGIPQERWFGADVAFTALGGEGIGELTAAASPGEETHRLLFPGG
jgi:hypothetical protein